MKPLKRYFFSGVLLCVKYYCLIGYLPFTLLCKAENVKRQEFSAANRRHSMFYKLINNKFWSFLDLGIYLSYIFAYDTESHYLNTA